MLHIDTGKVLTSFTWATQLTDGYNTKSVLHGQCHGKPMIRLLSYWASLPFGQYRIETLAVI